MADLYQNIANRDCIYEQFIRRSQEELSIAEEALLDIMGLSIINCTDDFFSQEKKHSWDWPEASSHTNSDATGQ